MWENIRVVTIGNGIQYSLCHRARGMKAEAQGQCCDNVWWFMSGDTLVLYGTGDTWLYRISDEDREGWRCGIIRNEGYFFYS